MSEQKDVLDEALAEMGSQARADEACSICHASVRPDRRDRHLDWHVSLSGPPIPRPPELNERGSVDGPTVLLIGAVIFALYLVAILAVAR